MKSGNPSILPTDDQHHPVVDDNKHEEDYFADVGFLFEANTPVRLEQFSWTIPSSNNHILDERSTDDSSLSSSASSVADSNKIMVALHVADENPGALQSGHYLWPASIDLAEYLVKNYASTTTYPITSVLELGAGCALVSITALQLWRSTLRVVVVTDHDPGVLARARDNLETTLQTILDDEAGDDDERLNAIINSVASIPVLFESLEWGHAQAMEAVQWAWQEHEADLDRVDLILGSDLIYDPNVVEPLFHTAMQLGKRFILSQSFRYDASTEQEIDRMCQQLKLQRNILFETPSTGDKGGGSDDNSGGNPQRRIQEFVPLEETTTTEDGTAAREILE